MDGDTADESGGRPPGDADLDAGLDEGLAGQRPAKRRVESTAIDEEDQHALEQKYERLDIARLGKAIELINNQLYLPDGGGDDYKLVALSEAVRAAHESMLIKVMEYVEDHFTRAMSL